jgi:cell division protein FtsI (penicillin-binding protein 3)
VAEDDYLPPRHGQHLVLTIDSNIQMIAQQQLGETCEQFRAKRGEAIVMDPRTGNVLAMANWPTFNPQNIEDSAPELRRNRCLTDPYEPGSTIKPFIVGPALAGNITRVNEVWPIPGKSYKSPMRAKPITDVYAYGPLATWDVLVKSSNIGMTMLGERMGRAQLHAALSGFGFGKPTGVALPGEDAGLLNPLASWKNYSIPSVCQGYEVMVTPMQLARGFCVYANGGHLVEPRIVKGVLDESGALVEHDPPAALESLPQVMDAQSAAAMRRVLADVPVRGTGTRARSRAYTIFGKTGTAHVSTGGAYNETSYTSSFVAGAPAENPQIVVAMIIHEPDRDWAIKNNLMYYGGTVAAPGAGKIVEDTLKYLDVPASPPLQPPPPAIASVLVRFDPRVYERFPDAASASAH